MANANLSDNIVKENNPKKTQKPLLIPLRREKLKGNKLKNFKN